MTDSKNVDGNRWVDFQLQLGDLRAVISAVKILADQPGASDPGFVSRDEALSELADRLVEVGGKLQATFEGCSSARAPAAAAGSFREKPGELRPVAKAIFEFEDRVAAVCGATSAVTTLLDKIAHGGGAAEADGEGVAWLSDALAAAAKALQADYARLFKMGVASPDAVAAAAPPVMLASNVNSVEPIDLSKVAALDDVIARCEGSARATRIALNHLAGAGGDELPDKPALAWLGSTLVAALDDLRINYDDVADALRQQGRAVVL